MSTEPEIDRELADALARLARATEVPPADPAREAALLAAFDARAASAARGTARRPRAPSGGLWLAGLATAAAVLIAVGLRPAVHGRVGTPPGATSSAQGSRAGQDARVQPDAGNEFIPWPGSASLPPLESGELVRVELPVTMLPSLGVTPPADHVTAVTADVVVGQDGLARAVRFVGN